MKPDSEGRLPSEKMFLMRVARRLDQILLTYQWREISKVNTLTVPSLCYGELHRSVVYNR